MRTKANVVVTWDSEEGESTPIRFVGHPVVLRVFMKCIAIHSAKNFDYNGGDDIDGDPLSNFRGAKELGINELTGLVLRMSDKFGRIKTYIKTGKLAVENEGVDDAFRDLLIYSALALALRSESISK